jgi:hypothetical protein
MMFACRLCGLTIEQIPDDAIQIGKLHKFIDGTFHWLRKKYAQRTEPCRQKHQTNSEHEAQEIYERT